MIQMIHRLGVLLGSFCVRIESHLGVILRWTRLLFDYSTKKSNIKKALERGLF